MTFEGPTAQAAGAEEFLQTIGGFAELVTDVNIIGAFGDDQRAMIMYEMTTRPFGTLRAVDYLVIRNGKIESDILVFDSHDVRKTQAAQEAPGSRST